MNILIIGAGRMGQLIAQEVKEKGHKVIALLDEHSNRKDLEGKTIDVAIDFSLPDGLEKWLPFLVESKIPLISGTTGLSNNQQKAIGEASGKIAILQSSNFSLGVHALRQLVATATKSIASLSKIVITERHHNKKIDAPSGTAKSLAIDVESNSNKKRLVGKDKLSNSQDIIDTDTISMNSIRGGNIVGDHKVEFIMNDEIITIEHRALNRIIFAQGAVHCINFIFQASPGLYSLNDCLTNK